MSLLASKMKPSETLWETAYSSLKNDECLKENKFQAKVKEHHIYRLKVWQTITQKIDEKILK